MDNQEYAKLPRDFRTAFEDKNGGLPWDDFVGRFWLNLAETWYQGWQLAVEYADELRSNDPPSVAPIPDRCFMLFVNSDGTYCARETWEYGGSTAACAKQPEPARVPPPPPPASDTSPWLEPKIPVTAAEAAAAGAEPKNPRKFIIVRASASPFNKWRWLVLVTDTELVKYGAYTNVDAAVKQLDQLENAEQMGSIYFISDAQLRHWQQNPQLDSIPREQVE